MTLSLGAVDRSPRATRASLARASAITFGWLGGIGLGLAFGDTLSPWAAAVLIAWNLWLSTGVFILAHDAMHGVLVPSSRRWNDRYGATLLFLYAFFPWRPMVREHRRHHAHPASENDPDFHAPGRPGPVAWYLRFTRTYVRWTTIAGYAITYNMLAHWVGISELNLVLFWIVPVVASTLQLFFFGTWLPHRAHADGYRDHHRAHTSAWPEWLSLLTCFHFGYHWEHHAWPHLPWYRLPDAHRHAPLSSPSTDAGP